MASAQVGIAVWDLPVRLAHWAVAALLPLLWWTAEQGAFGWHIALGATMLGLVAFRLLWGLVGSETARFSGFVRSPRAVLAYLRGAAERRHPAVVGHNPAGGYSVLAMLAVLVLQVALGLVSGDPDDDAVGPLNHLVSFTTAYRATELHEALFNGLAALVALHVLAVLFHLLVRRDNLIRPMITGIMAPRDYAVQPRLAPLRRAVPCLLVAAALAAWLYAGAPPIRSNP